MAVNGNGAARRTLGGLSRFGQGTMQGTENAAALLGLEGEIGVIAAGELADIVVWNSNPLADITVLQRPHEISAVIKDGRLVVRGAGASGNCQRNRVAPGL
jgi:cytosine/adenosine deaminase-related metal-dependent hydrolase